MANRSTTEILNHLIKDQLETDHHFPFLKNAEAMLKKESIIIFIRHQSEIVSPAYVEEDQNHLINISEKRFFKYLGTLGGILLGVSITNLTAMTFPNQYSPIGTIVSASLGIVGAFLIALYVTKE